MHFFLANDLKATVWHCVETYLLSESETMQRWDRSDQQRLTCFLSFACLHLKLCWLFLCCWNNPYVWRSAGSQTLAFFSNIPYMFSLRQNNVYVLIYTHIFTFVGNIMNRLCTTLNVNGLFFTLHSAWRYLSDHQITWCIVGYFMMVHWLIWDVDVDIRIWKLSSKEVNLCISQNVQFSCDRISHDSCPACSLQCPSSSTADPHEQPSWSSAVAWEWAADPNQECRNVDVCRLRQAPVRACAELIHS